MRRRFLPLVAAVVLCFQGYAHALTLSSILTNVRRNIRDTATNSALQRYSDSVLTDFANEAQRDVVSNTWILSKSTSIALSANTTYYSLPTDLIAIQRVTNSFGNLPEVTLQQQDADNNNSSWETSGSTPTYYFQDPAQNNKIGIAPYPTTSAQAGTMRIIYYAFATDLSAGSDVPFNSLNRFSGYHDLLVWYVTYRILYIEALADKAALFKQLYDTRLGVLLEDYGAKPNKVPELPTKENK